ncbi:MAG: hypothetical protein ACXWUF_17100 [Methylomagnum sp.]
MSKKITIGAKPTTRPVTADDWVESRKVETEAAEEMKRLTFDVSESLHRRIKSQCAAKGVKMADELRELLEKHFPANTVAKS